MSNREDAADRELKKLLAAIADEEVPESSPEFYAHEMERVLQRKKELEAEAALQESSVSVKDNTEIGPDEQSDNKNTVATSDNPREEKSRPDLQLVSDQYSKPHGLPTDRSRNKRMRNTWRSLIAIAAMFVFLIGGTVLTRGKLRTPVNIGQPGGQITVVDFPGGQSIDPGKDRQDTSQLTGTEDAGSFLEDMWLFLKASLPYLGGTAIIVAGGYVVLKATKRKDKLELSQ